MKFIHVAAVVGSCSGCSAFPCAAILESPILFASQWNRLLEEYRTNPSETDFVSATTFADFDLLCASAQMSVILKNSVLRQKLVRHHHRGGYKFSEDPVKIISTPNIALHLIGIADIHDLVNGQIVSPSELSSLFIFWTRFEPSRPCRPFDYCGSWNTFVINKNSGCSSVELRGLGRAFGLAVLFHVAINKWFNTALVSILLGKRNGWDLGDLRSDNIWNFTKILRESNIKTRDEFNDRIDEMIFGDNKEALEIVCTGFEDIVPREVTNGFLTGEELDRILAGQWNGLVLESSEMSITIKLFVSYINISYTTALSVFNIVTGLQYPPVGGMAVMSPHASIELIPCGDEGVKIHADQTRRILYVPDCDSIIRLQGLLKDVIVPRWDLL